MTSITTTVAWVAYMEDGRRLMVYAAGERDARDQAEIHTMGLCLMVRELPTDPSCVVCSDMGCEFCPKV